MPICKICGKPCPPDRRAYCSAECACIGRRTKQRDWQRASMRASKIRPKHTNAYSARVSHESVKSAMNHWSDISVHTVLSV